MTRGFRTATIVVLALVLGVYATASFAQDAADVELAKKLSNPLASLISVPFQFNWDDGIGDNDADRFLLNIQPVIPMSISEDWNLISRTILPVIYQDDIPAGAGSEFGIGDIVQSLFFSPKQPANGWIWGVGPAFLLPTSTDDLLGGDEWAAGPTAVVLRQDGPITWGALVNHLWDIAGPDRTDINATFLQPFLSYTTPTATTIGINTEATYDWNESQWNIPINVFVNQMVQVGRQRMQLGLGGRYFSETPRGGADWGLRLNVIFLFPK